MNFRKIVSKIVVIVLIVLHQTMPKSALSQTTSFIHYGVEQGLIQSQVQSILQDNKGNLWIGTMGGVSKFNGKKFTTFKKKNGLAEDWVTTSFLDKSGNIWIGHWGGGISFYNNKTSIFSDLQLERDAEFKSIRAIAEDKNGLIWIATEGAGIIVYDINTLTVKKVTTNEGLSSDLIYTLYPFENKILAGTSKGLVVIDQTNRSADLVLHPELSIKAISRRENDWLLGTVRNGIVSTDLHKESNYSIVHELKNEVSFIFNDNDKVWIGTKGEGVKVLKKDGSTANYSVRQGLSFFNVNCIFKDRESNVWIGTDLGLNQYRGERFQIIDQTDGLSNNIVWALLEDRAKNIWAGTNNGLSKISFDTQNQLQVLNYNLESGLTSNVVLSLFEDNDGGIYIGTAFGGLCKYDPVNNKIQKITLPDIREDLTVFSITQDNEGFLWLGTREGAIKLNTLTSEILIYNSQNGLNVNSVFKVYKDKSGNIWLGALGGNLAMYNGSTIRQFTADDGVNHKFFLCMNEDKAGNLWLGAYGGGLYRFDGQSFKNFTSDDGLITESPYSVLPDNDGNLWIGTTNGIEKFNPEKGALAYYAKKDGFLGVETNANAICSDDKGNIWFGTIMGLLKFSPSEDKPNFIEPLTQIEGLKLFFTDGEFPSDATFSYSQNHLTFVFSGISLTSPEKVLYQYKLEGFDQSWSPAGDITEAIYSNLPPGQYRFLVKAANNDGVWNSEPVVYSFTITPPFWSTWWFRTLLGMLLVTFIWGITAIRTRKLKAAKKELENKVALRTEELANKNMELLRKNKEITDSINYAKRIQEAILPDKRKIKLALPESFIFYQPKDIVSGDFYFFTERDDYIIISSVDCTGHGVPGALMSMIGVNFLNQIVNEQGIIEPELILKELHKKVIRTLNAADSERSSVDGMDLGIVRINKKTFEIVYSGALRPFYFFTNNEFIEIKGDRYSIGAIKEIDQVSFSKHIINANKGDVFYIFSDGFADQFGELTGKKFMTQKFKSLLAEIRNLSMDDQQKHIEETFSSWKGKLDQVDDILVVGVKI
jgi:ligand-binding sensor domain-containing protein/serine phosphatase RsbU (regulator of sigma subunit)